MNLIYEWTFTPIKIRNRYVTEKQRATYSKMRKIFTRQCN